MKAVIGAAVICVCFFMLGKKATERDRTAVKHLYGVLKLLRHIKDCISISLTPLPDIYKTFEFNEKYMAEFEKKLKSGGFAYAVQDLVLPEEAYLPLRELAFALGKTDSENQCKKLESTIGILETVYRRFKETEQQKSKSIQALFSLAGAVAAILMF